MSDHLSAQRDRATAVIDKADTIQGERRESDMFFISGK